MDSKAGKETDKESTQGAGWQFFYCPVPRFPLHILTAYQTGNFAPSLQYLACVYTLAHTLSNIRNAQSEMEKKPCVYKMI